MKEEIFPSLSKTELANAYGKNGISLQTLATWLKPFQNEIGEYRGKLYTPKQIQIIFDKLGRPERY